MPAHMAILVLLLAVKFSFCAVYDRAIKANEVRNTLPLSEVHFI